MLVLGGLAFLDIGKISCVLYLRFLLNSLNCSFAADLRGDLTRQRFGETLEILCLFSMAAVGISSNRWFDWLCTEMKMSARASLELLGFSFSND